jgi:hypothetical protein
MFITLQRSKKKKIYHLYFVKIVLIFLIYKKLSFKFRLKIIVNLLIIKLKDKNNMCVLSLLFYNIIIFKQVMNEKNIKNFKSSLLA